MIVADRRGNGVSLLQRRDKINSLIKKHSELLKPLAFSKEGAGDDESGTCACVLMFWV